MNRFNNLRLKTRLSLVAVLGMVIPFGLLIWQGKHALDTAIQVTLQDRLKLARSTALHLDQELRETMDALGQVAASLTSPLQNRDLKEKKGELKRLYRPQLFQYVFLLNNEGRVLWIEPYMPEVVGVRRLESPHVQEALHTGLAAIACMPHVAPLGQEGAFMVVPVRNRQGAVVGLLGGALNLSSMAFIRALTWVILGKTEYAQVVSENGLILAHTRVEKIFNKSDHADLFASLLREKKAAVSTHTVTEEGKGTIQEVIAFAPLSQAPWGVSVEQAEEELMAPAQHLRRSIAISAIIALIVAFFMTGVTAHSIIEPVHKLVAASGRIANGDLATPVPPLGEDEIGEMGRHFEEMRGRLASWGEEMETKVKEKTRAIRISHGVLEITNRHTDMAPMLNQVVTEIRQLTGYAAVGVRLLNEGGSIPYQAYEGFSQQFYERENPISINSDQCMCINVIKGMTDPSLPFYTAEGSFYMNGAPWLWAKVSEGAKGKVRNICGQFGYNSVAVIPIRVGSRTLGLIHVADLRENMIPLEMVETLEGVAMQLGEAIQRLKIEEEARRLAKENAIIAEIGRIIGSTLNIEEVYGRFAEEAKKLISFDRILVNFINHKDATFTVTYMDGFGVDGGRAGDTYSLQGSASEEALRTRSSLLFPPESQEDLNARFPRFLPHFEAGLRSVMIIPLFSGDVMVGSLHLQSKKTEAYTDQDLKLAERISAQIAGAIANAQLFIERKRVEEALRESEEQLRDLSSRILKAQETERRRISRELHDELGGSLAVLKLGLSSIAKNLQKEQIELRKECQENLQYMDQVIENVYRISRDLSPQILEDLGISAALRWLINNFIKNYKLRVQSDIMDIDRLFPRDAQMMLYRILQEALTNIGKHAQAKNVSVVVQKDNHSVSLLVEDDGKGFNANQAFIKEGTETGLGLRTINERARLLGGSMDLWSQEGKGTRIILMVPIKKGISR